MIQSIRLAKASDMSILFEWRNLPEVRMVSRNTQVVSNSDHELWFKNRLLRIEEEPIFILTEDNQRIGMSRLDVIDEVNLIFEVSILISPEYRGKGLARFLIMKTCEFGFNKLRASEIQAYVKESNNISAKLFDDSGFRVIQSDFGYVKFSLLL